MKWISVKEQLPSPDSYIIVRGCRSVDDEECDIFIGYVNIINNTYVVEEIPNYSYPLPIENITHWMYLSDLLLTLSDPTDKLRPCPRCGSCDVVLENNGFDEVYTGVRYTCINRHAWDEWFSNEEKARKAWNETP